MIVGPASQIMLKQLRELVARGACAEVCSLYPSKLFSLEVLKPLSVFLHIIHRLTLNSGQIGLLRKAHPFPRSVHSES